VPPLEDVTAKTGITLKHAADPAKKYIVESMSGGVIVFDYDRDGWPDIYFTNAPTVEMAIKGQKTRGALYHNNHDGTFTDVTGKARLTSSCFAMGNDLRAHFGQVFAGQTVGIKEVHDDIWLVSFMDYDLGYFDLETRVLEPLENPFGPKVLPMS